MAFSGTMEKCKACDKTVYLVELLTADGKSYHKSCFKCSHCQGKLTISTYSSMEGVLYCKPHFEQLFKQTGGFTAMSSPHSGKSEKNLLPRAPSKLSAFFSGTQDKCATCRKTVYPLEKVSVEGESFHKSCFKCSHGGCSLSASSYAALNGILYCKPHFAQLFKEKGSYNHLIRSASERRNPTPAETEPHRKAESEPEPEPEPDTADE